MTILYFVRHGKTDHSGRRLCGNIPGIHLNQTGREQADKIASFFEKIPIKSIYTSPVERAIETALTTANKKLLPVEEVEYLREIDFGDYQGKGEELQRDPLWNTFLKTPTEIHFPNGETVSQAQKRVVEGLNEISVNSPDDEEIMAVAHCEILRFAIAHALNMPLEEYMRLTLDTGSISKVAWSEGHKKVLFLNHSPH
jgi:probable phosphoglycerate mutase